ncbi:hypothetical protein CCR75_000990 [Bremia lactucae]|uniref:Protein transport protein Sec61 subunit beta n=1 Tax=Bremia lactucae TaxID=4779 RepID=A0A976II11_BRELC|nr:hypothetical protein CCR75_000990 [Bremia lactucae]
MTEFKLSRSIRCDQYKRSRVTHAVRALLQEEIIFESSKPVNKLRPRAHSEFHTSHVSTQSYLKAKQSTAAGATGGLSGKKPAPSASAEGAAASGLRNRRPVTAARSGQNTGRGMGGSSAGILRFYTDDSPGLKIGPTTVLVSCLMFVGFVVMLHVWGKFRG